MSWGQESQVSIVECLLSPQEREQRVRDFYDVSIVRFKKWLTTTPRKHRKAFLTNVRENLTSEADFLGIDWCKLPKNWFKLGLSLDHLRTCRLCKETRVVPKAEDAQEKSTCVSDLHANGTGSHEFGPLDDENWLGFAQIPNPDPEASKLKRKRKIQAATLDGEFVEGGMGPDGEKRSVLVALTVTNLMTNEIVIHTLVKPDREVTDWREHKTGLNQEIFDTADATNRTMSLEALHKQLFSYIDSDTILVGWALSNDFKAIKICGMTKILDLQVYYCNTRQPERFPRLQDALATFGVRIQEGPSHSSLEDTLATSELAQLLLAPEPWAIVLQHLVEKRADDNLRERKANTSRMLAVYKGCEREPNPSEVPAHTGPFTGW